LRIAIADVKDLHDHSLKQNLWSCNWVIA
jgi:hypothetical protein